jgi:ABC-type glycerol-3-phosphate transport system permease component
VVCSVSASLLAVWIGSLAAYGLSRFSYRFGPMRNKDIAFFFLSQLILPPVVLALPFLVLYKELALLDTTLGLVLLYTLMVLPIVIWVMRDQFGAIPIELEEAALVDGLSVWGAFLRIVLPLALPFLVLYKELALLDTSVGLILLYTLMVLPIVIWVMRDQFSAIPIELEEAALVDGLSVWGAFARIVLPLALPGMVAAFILSLVLCWNEYFFAALLTSTDAKTLPVMVASQTGSQGINWWSMAALSTAAIAPLVLVGIFLERYIIKGMTAGAGR